MLCPFNRALHGMLARTSVREGKITADARRDTMYVAEGDWSLFYAICCSNEGAVQPAEKVACIVSNAVPALWCPILERVISKVQISLQLVDACHSSLLSGV